jgi:uncharacterized membrane protein YeaQ/YmgE (transglycosylase-associated protein family)
MKGKIMEITTVLLVGLFVGWIASFLVEGQGLGTLKDILVGILGSFVGGFLLRVLGLTAYGLWGSLMMSVVGAVVFLFIVELLTRPRPYRKSLDDF